MRRAAGTLGAVTVLSVTACGGSSGGEARETSSSTTATTPTKTAGLDGFASCAFPEGSPVSEARLATVGPALTVTWVTPEGAVRGTSDSLLTVNLGSEYQVGFSHIGTESNRYVFDLRNAKQTNLSGAYTDLPEQTSMVLGFKDIARVSNPVEWYAAVGVDARDAARCPAEGTVPFPE